MPWASGEAVWDSLCGQTGTPEAQETGGLCGDVGVQHPGLLTDCSSPPCQCPPLPPFIDRLSHLQGFEVTLGNWLLPTCPARGHLLGDPTVNPCQSGLLSLCTVNIHRCSGGGIRVPHRPVTPTPTPCHALPVGLTLMPRKEPTRRWRGLDLAAPA